MLRSIIERKKEIQRLEKEIQRLEKELELEKAISNCYKSIAISSLKLNKIDELILDATSKINNSK